jgi:hypothetical protein
LTRPKTYRERLRGLLHLRLSQLAERVYITLDDGTKTTYPMETWKEWARARLAPHVESTEDLPDPEYHRFILALEAHGASVMGIEWPEREAQP